MTTTKDTRTPSGARQGSAEEVGTPDRRRRPVRLDRVGLYGLLGIAAVTALFPLFWMLSGSLQTLPELLANESFLPTDPQWGNYVTAWVQGDLGTYLRNSVIYTACAVVGILLVSSLAGYALARLDFAGKGAFTVVLLAVMIIPAPAMFLAQYKLLISLGLTNSPVGYVLVLITSGIPMSTLIMRSFFAGQPKDLEEAAALDGAGPLTIFARIILPLARPGLAAVAVIQGLAAWNEYLMALVIFDDNALMPVQRGLTAFTSAETPQQQVLLAATAISIVPVVIFYLMAQRHIVQGIGAGAIK
ncbi:carbohydrate ABC transporter permease [Promicromonospora sp. NPDC060204]|uniref:carbohydrate ABC transporter permease n=1 Tax=Promicromonospora sp. NPDC060204 TaxID=3347071 RepID=UPI0036563F94